MTIESNQFVIDNDVNNKAISKLTIKNNDIAVKMANE